jgi:DNA helicase HerA-like ATPase
MAQSLSEDSFLVLGWQVNPEGHPIYWLNKNAQYGLQADNDLVRVSADRMDSHTVIVAQSGSGKSFFLGRLVEELLLRTKCRCLVFDQTETFRVWTSSTKMSGNIASMIQFLEAHYYLMKQMKTLNHHGEESQGALELDGHGAEERSESL